jgi:hypothetical protein
MVRRRCPVTKGMTWSRARTICLRMGLHYDGSRRDGATRHGHVVWKSQGCSCEPLLPSGPPVKCIGPTLLSSMPPESHRRASADRAGSLGAVADERPGPGHPERHGTAMLPRWLAVAVGLSGLALVAFRVRQAGRRPGALEPARARLRHRRHPGLRAHQ